MNIIKQSGKITFIGFIIILIVVYGAFVVVKIISTSLTESQIENKVSDTFVSMRGSGFNPREGEEAIKKILQERDDIILNEDHVISVEIDKRRSEIVYFFEYELMTNFLLFKSMKKVEVKDHIKRYD